MIDREEGRSVFGTAAAEYAAGRPGYPDRVYEILRDRCGLRPSSHVLEIGPGTGQATARLVEIAAAVVAVEPSPPLATVLRELLPTERLEILVEPFEDVVFTSSSFDLVASATAFHWLDPDVAFPKVRSVLRRGGWLALWWNVFGDPDLPDPFHDATEKVLPALPTGPSGSRGGEHGLDVDERLRELSDHGFLEAQHESVRWTLVLDPTRTRQLYASYSNVARQPAAVRTAILDELERIAREEFGGRVERQMVTPVYTAHT
jgi:SAM-dependent methyltransferase